MPKVSIVIPVYKVEKYLAECLDSVVSQTLRDIEIICVDDGSPDRCPEILEDYAARDSRITVIHKENGGLSSARNAAYPYIRGKYTLFVDSDDTITPTLCEKVLKVAEEKDADMTLFLFYSENIVAEKLYRQASQKGHFPDDTDLGTLLIWVTAWSKLFRSSFLLENSLTFPVGLLHEDGPQHWNAMMCHPHLAFVPEKLYYWRSNSASIMANPSLKSATDALAGYTLIKENLVSKNLYSDEWKRLYLEKKLRGMCMHYYRIAAKDRPALRGPIRDLIGQDERDYLASPNALPWYTKDFYRALDGSTVAQIKCVFNNILRQTIHKSHFCLGACRHTALNENK